MIIRLKSGWCHYFVRKVWYSVFRSKIEIGLVLFTQRFTVQLPIYLCSSQKYFIARGRVIYP